MSFPLGLAFINNIKFTVELQIVPWKCHVFFFLQKYITTHSTYPSTYVVAFLFCCLSMLVS